MLKFFAEKMYVAFAVQKLLTYFSAKNIRILDIESAKTVNQTSLNELVKLTTLWTTGLRTRERRLWSHHANAQTDLSPWLNRAFRHARSLTELKESLDTTECINGGWLFAHAQDDHTLREITIEIVFIPFWKRANSKRKEFAPFGSKFLP